MPSRWVLGHAPLGNIVSFDIPLSTIFWCFPSNSENLTDFRKTVETGMDPYLKLTLNPDPPLLPNISFSSLSL